MNTSEDLFNCGKYVTAQVVIPADDFALSILGYNPTPRQLEDFIKDHASLMEVVYGTAEIAKRPNVVPLLEKIHRNTFAAWTDAAYIRSKIEDVVVLDMLKDKRPWWRRLFGR